MEKKEIENLLDNYYAQKHTGALVLAEKNLQIANQNKAFQELYQKDKILNCQIGKAKAYNDTKQAKKLEAEQKEVKTKLETIMQKMGISQASLKPQYACKLCQDTGKINGQNCTCYKKRFYKLLAENYNNKKLANFKDFDLSVVKNKSQKEQLTKAKDIFEKLAKAIPHNRKHNYTLCGKTGVGKTFLAECLVTKTLENGKLALFVSSTEMNNYFLQYHTTFNNEKLYYSQILREPDLLVIDDLGTEPILNNVTLDYLTSLLDDRNNEQRTTVITTNLSPAQILERYGDRIQSRMINKKDGYLIKIDGDDLRLIK